MVLIAFTTGAFRGPARRWRVLLLALALLVPVFNSSYAAQALGSKGLTRQQSAAVFDGNENYALIVGVDRYDEIGNLRYAVADAKALGAYFESQGYDTEVLLNDRARRKLILKKLRDIAELAGDGSGDNGNVVFAFSGHGFRADEQNYLATVQTELSDIRGTSLALSAVQTILGEAKVRQRVLLIDACRDDPERPTKGAQGKRGSFVADGDAEGVAVLYSTGADRRSWEDSKLGQGVFTHYLLKGLEGGAADPEGFITFDGLQHYVRNRVKNHVREHFRAVQVPYIGGERSGEFVLAKVAVQEKPILPPVAQAEPTPPAVEPVLEPMLEPAPIAMGRLWIHTEPAGARVRIMNIAPKYSDGMALEHGKRYDVLVSKSGYRSWREHVVLESEKRVVVAVLEKEQEVVEHLPYEPEMVTIPTGSFPMGCSSSDSVCRKDEKPVHKVYIKSFRLAKTEVTVGQFRAFVQDANYTTHAERNTGKKGCRTYEQVGWLKKKGRWVDKKGLFWKEPGFSQNDDHPVVCVDWKDVQVYIAWLNLKTGKQYRLPSEAEWEYSARAGSTGTFNWNRNTASIYANHGEENCCTGALNGNDLWKNTAPVGQLRANRWGLYDMQGNVWEWVQDTWHANYDGAPRTATAWMAGGERSHVSRGGGWYNGPLFFRPSLRAGKKMNSRSNSFGFRLAENHPGP